jgi:flagellar protein FliS
MNPYSRHSRAATAYQDAVLTQAPARQIVLLYDGAIRRLHEARVAILEGRIEDRCRLVLKAFEILRALQSCLDFERGGAVAPLLQRYYGHAMNRMMQINQKNDPALCDELVAYLEPMRASWARIAEGTAPGPSASQPAPAAAAASAPLTA